MSCKKLTKLWSLVIIFNLCLSVVVSANESEWHFGRTIQLYRFPPFSPPSHWGNSCSQYVAASLLESIGLNVDKKRYNEIGREINPLEEGVVDTTLVRFLDKYFRCETVHNASYETIWRHLTAGYPVIATVEIKRTLLHSVLIAGVVISPNGNLSHWLVEDNGLVRGIVPYQEFEVMWSCPNNENEGHSCILIHPNEQQKSLACLEASDIVANLAAQNTAYLPKVPIGVDDGLSVVADEKSDVIDVDLSDEVEAEGSSLIVTHAAAGNSCKVAIKTDSASTSRTPESRVFGRVASFVENEFPNVAWLIPYGLIPVYIFILFYVLRMIGLLLPLALRLVNRER